MFLWRESDGLMSVLVTLQKLKGTVQLQYLAVETRALR